MEYPKFAGSQERLVPTAALAAVVILAGWMGYAYGGYFIGVWALVVFLLAGLVLVAALSGVLRRFQLGWAGIALAFFMGTPDRLFCRSSGRRTGATPGSALARPYFTCWSSQ